MVGPDAEEIAAAIIAACDRTEEYVRATVAAAPAVIDAALDAVRVGWPVSVPLPGPVKDAMRGLIMQAVREVAQLIYDGLENFRLLARSVGRPSVLRAAATVLDTQVIAPALALDGAMTSSALGALSRDSWDSRAADSYTTAFNEQSRAVGAVDEPARALRNSLEDLAESIERFFSDLQLAYVSFTVTVAGLALAIATAVPTWGIGSIISLAVAVVSAILGIVALISAFTGTASRNEDMASRLADSDALHWPRSAFAV